MGRDEAATWGRYEAATGRDGAATRGRNGAATPGRSEAATRDRSEADRDKFEVEGRGRQEAAWTRSHESGYHNDAGRIEDKRRGQDYGNRPRGGEDEGAGVGRDARQSKYGGRDVANDNYDNNTVMSPKYGTGFHASTPKGAEGKGGKYEPYTPSQGYQPLPDPQRKPGAIPKISRVQEPLSVHKQQAQTGQTEQIQKELQDHKEQIRILTEMLKQKDDEIRQKSKPSVRTTAYEAERNPFAAPPAPVPRSIREDEEFLLNLVKVVSSSSSNHGSFSSHSSSIKAAPIEMPQFDGDYTEYPMFTKHLEYHMGRQTGLSEVEKFAVLRAHLEGAALDKVASLDGISDTSYSTARSLLEEVYGDKQATRDAVLQEFQGYKGTYSYTGTEMEVATDQLCLLITRCREVGIPEAYLTTSVGEILRKLPAKVREDLLDLQDKSLTPITMDEVLLILRKHARRAIRNERSLPRQEKKIQTFNQVNTTKDDKKPPKKEYNEPPRPPKTPGGRYYRDFSSRPCFYCDGRHTEFQCRKSHEEKLKRVKEKKACANCLGTDHKIEDCPSEGKCRFFKCQGRHHTTLCVMGSSMDKKEASTDAKDSSTLTVTSSQQAIQAHFQTEASNPGKGRKCQIAVLVDQGSTDSFVLEDTARKLRLPTLGYRQLRSATCFTDERKILKARRVEMNLKTLSGDDFKIEALAVPSLVPSITLQPVKLTDAAKRFIQEAKDVTNAPPREAITTEINLLLGNAVYGRVMRPATNCQQIDENQDLVAYSTPFGTILSGVVGGKDEDISESQVFFQKCDPIKTEDPLLHEVRQNWKLENMGVSLREQKPDKDNSRDTRELLERAKKDEDGRWEIRLPFRKNHHGIHPNWGKVYGRLKSITKRLTDEQRKEYFKTWEDLVKAGYLEPAPTTTIPGSVVHYLPHFAVVKEASLTTKIRPVLDAAAATVQGECLNDLLITGPQVGEELIDILIRFQFGCYAIVSDVAKAFYAIGIAKEDRDAVRVLLPIDPNKPIDETNVKAWRYRRLVMGATCSSWILNSLLRATIENKIADEDYKAMTKEQLNTIKHSFYADNSIYTVETIAEGKTMAVEGQKVYDGDLFHLREYCSTNTEILKDLPTKDVHQLEVIKVLGMDWGTVLDLIFLHKNKEYKVEIPTRRQMVSHIAAIYDPYGLFTPVTIWGRVLEREALQDGTKWDKQIEESHVPTWKELLQDINEIHKIQLPRNVREVPENALRIVAFGDASRTAFAAVVYAWQWTTEGARCHLVISRAKLTPKDHKATIPRMELLALRSAALLAEKVVKSLQGQKVESVTIFSDSQIALYWAFSDKRLPQYEAARVNDIRETGFDDLRHVGTKENPADLPSRGATTEEIDSFWLNGPQFLKKRFEDWPRPWQSLPTDEETFACVFACTVQDHTPGEKPFGGRIDLNLHLSFNKLVRITSYLRRFLYERRKHETWAISGEERKKAEMIWIKYAQDGEYPGLRECLQKGSKPCKMTKKLRLYIDEDGLIQSEGRDKWIHETEESQDLILLPKGNQITKMIILDSHNAGAHRYDKAILQDLLRKYWVTGGIRTIGSTVRHKCPRCILAKGKPLKRPKAGQIPQTRLQKDKPPFETTGLDYFGPIKVKTESGGVTKRWVLLLTCGATRAVHLELVQSVSAESTILGLERFYARRGLSQGTIYLDNARGNVAAMGLHQELEETLKETDFPAKVDYHFSALSKQVKFIPVRAPWFAGFYERLVGAVKTSLKPALWKNTLEEEKMRTMLCRIEAMLNARPLTAPSLGPEEPQALTPGHFLFPLGQAHFPMLPDKPPSSPTKSNKELRAMREKTDKMLRIFWDRWQQEYLSELCRRHREMQKEQKGAIPEGPTEGDVYLLVELAPRETWKMVRILEAYPDKQGVVRTCKVLHPSKATSLRSVTHLVPLEFSD